MKKIILLSAQRSGSTFLMLLLDSHPDITFAGELFKAKDPLNIHRPEFSFWKFKNRFGAFLGRRIRPNFFKFFSLSDAFSNFGFKLMVGQIRSNPLLKKHIENNDISIIRLYRENVFETYLSHHIATETKVWYSDGSDVKQIKFSIDVEQMLKELAFLENEKKEVLNTFSNNKSICIKYEDLVMDKTTNINLILDFLKVPNMTLEAKSAKVNKQKHEELITNFEEVLKALKGTEYEKYIVQ